MRRRGCGVLQRLLRQVDVAQRLREHGQDPPRLVPQRPIQRLVRLGGPPRYIAWGERMADTGHGSERRGARLSDVFTDPGRILSADDGVVVATDGPLAETKEVVGGYGVITAADYGEAVELCRDHPAIGGIGRIVVRQLA